MATAGGSVILDGLEATIIGTQMLLEHNNVNIQQMQDGPLKTSVIALKDYGDLLIVGGALVSRQFSTGPRIPFISKTEQTGGLVKYTFHNDEVGLALQDMRASNKLDLNLTKIRTLINSLDGFTSYRMRSAKKHLEAFELDAKFQKLSENSSRHYVHFDVNSQRPQFRFVYNTNGIAHSKHSLFDVAFENNQIQLSNIDWLPTYTTGNVTSIAKFANIRYPKDGQIVTGNIEVVRNSNGQFYMRIPPFDVLLASLQTKFTGHSNILAWLDEIPETKITLLKKLDDLPVDQTLFVKLDGDLLNVQSLKGYFLTDNELVEAWNEISELPSILRTDLQFLNGTKDLIEHNLFQNIGAATKGEIVNIHRYTVNSDYLNFPMRGPYSENPLYLPTVNLNNLEYLSYQKIVSGLQKLRQTNRLETGIVYRGRALSQNDFDVLFGTNSPQDIPIKGFASCTKNMDIAEEFAKSNFPGVAYRMIWKIKSKDGVYINDFADWGQILGPLNHSSSPLIMNQEEVLMEEGLFRKLSSRSLILC